MLFVRSNPSQSDRRGFTLIELLVVIAIISLLVSILLPSLSRAKELAMRVLCSTNMRSIGTAVYMYAEDHDGALPWHRWNIQYRNTVYNDTGQEWYTFGLLYQAGTIDTAQIFYCPANTATPPRDWEYFQERWAQELPDQSIGTHYAERGYDYSRTDKNMVFKALEDLGNRPYASDGLDRKRRYSHKNGANVFYGDSSVLWYDDSDQLVYDSLAGTGKTPTELLWWIWDDMFTRE